MPFFLSFLKQFRAGGRFVVHVNNLKTCGKKINIQFNQRNLYKFVTFGDTTLKMSWTYDHPGAIPGEDIYCAFFWLYFKQFRTNTFTNKKLRIDKDTIACNIRYNHHHFTTKMYHIQQNQKDTCEDLFILSEMSTELFTSMRLGFPLEYPQKQHFRILDI